MAVFGSSGRFKGPVNLIENLLWQHRPFVSQLPLIFVVGAPRSGTTLLQRILAQHSSTFSVDNETGIFTYTDLFAPGRLHFGLSRAEADALLASSGSAAELLERGVHEIRRSRGHGEDALFIEKTPSHCLHAQRIARYFPRAHFVEIVRDGRDCFVSARKHSGIPQNRSSERFARYWMRCVAAMDDPRFRAAAGNRHIRIRYEDLCADPASQSKRLMAALNLTFETQQLDAKLRTSDSRSQRKEFSRLSDEISLASVDTWVDRLTSEDLAIFNRLAGSRLAALGYAQGTPE